LWILGNCWRSWGGFVATDFRRCGSGGFSAGLGSWFSCCFLRSWIDSVPAGLLRSWLCRRFSCGFGKDCSVFCWNPGNRLINTVGIGWPGEFVCSWSWFNWCLFSCIQWFPRLPPCTFLWLLINSSDRGWPRRGFYLWHWLGCFAVELRRISWFFAVCKVPISVSKVCFPPDGPESADFWPCYLWAESEKSGKPKSR
jgi:hypothetical protein